MTVKQLIQALQKLDEDAKVIVANNYDVDPNDVSVISVDTSSGYAKLRLDNSCMLFDINVFGMYNWKAWLLHQQRDHIANVLKDDNLDKTQLHDKIVQAMSIDKVDPIQFLPEFMQMAFIDLSNVREFKFETQHNGMQVYQVDETAKIAKNGQFFVSTNDGQLAIRWILNNTLGTKVNPWCWIQNCQVPCSNEYKNLDLDSLWWWSLYSYEDKKVAIKDKKIHAFRAISLYDAIAYRRNNGIDQIVDVDDFYKYCKPWSNRQNIQSAYLQ